MILFFIMMQHIGLDKGLSIPDIAIVYRYLVSASTYSTHYKEVPGDPKTNWDAGREHSKGIMLDSLLQKNQSKNHEASPLWSSLPHIPTGSQPWLLDCGYTGRDAAGGKDAFPCLGTSAIPRGTEAPFILAGISEPQNISTSLKMNGRHQGGWNAALWCLQSIHGSAY